MNNQKLIISDFHDGILLGFQLENNKLERVFDFSQEGILGNIYCGYVKDIAKNINAAFVEFAEGKKGYLSLKNYAGQICQGDRVLVQVSGDKIKTKEYTLSGKINLNSKCLVFTVGKTDISISRKISDNEKREELKQILSEFKNDEYGFILRTNSVNFSAGEILQQAKDLIKRWEEIKNKFKYASIKSVIVRNDYMTSMCTEFIEKFKGDLMTDNLNAFKELKNIGLPVSFNGEEKISLCNKYSLEKHLREALCKKVWLKSAVISAFPASLIFRVYSKNSII